MIVLNRAGKIIVGYSSANLSKINIMSSPKTSFKICLAILLCALCIACNSKTATVVNRSKNFYGKYNAFNKDKYRNSGKKNSGTNSRLTNHQIEVGNDETIYKISKKYQVPLRDLIKQNNLAAPYKLSAGTKLIIPAPSYHEVESGDTIYSIARNYKMNIESLVELNDLKAPYVLVVGRRIRVTKFVSEDSAVVTAGSKKSEKLNEQASEQVEQSEEKSGPSSFIEKTLDKFNHFSWPIYGEVISKFGPKSGGLYNDGINIKAAEGDAVKAAEDGVVSYAGNELKGYGNLVIVKHSGGWITAYAHLSKISVKRGQKVTKLGKIGEVGSSGNVGSPQLYFGLRKGRDAVNPENYLTK